MKTVDELRRLEKLLEETRLPRARREWGGADIVITRKPSKPHTEKGFYPDPRFTVTEHALELSYLFEKLKDAFYAEDRLDGFTKLEFFGRLADAANRAIAQSPSQTAHTLLASVLQEAFTIYDEMESL